MKIPQNSNTSPPMDSTAAVISCMFGFIIPPFYPPQFPSKVEGLGTGLSLRTRMLSVILQTADVPVVCPHGLYAARIVALSNKVHLVLSNLTQVFATVIHHLCDCLESRTSPNGIRAARLRKVRLVAQIDSVTRIARGGSPTVRRKQHSTMFVRGFLAALAQCAGYIVNTGLPCYFCHKFVKVF